MSSQRKPLNLSITLGIIAFEVFAATTAGAATEATSGPSFAYTLGDHDGITAEVLEDKIEIQGAESFELFLMPANGVSWNMDAVSILGLEAANHGDSEIIFDLRLENEGATDWSDSSLGRAILKPGEQLPLGVVLYRDHMKQRHPDYERMNGLPNGHIGHWQVLDASNVIKLRIMGATTGTAHFEIGELYTIRPIEEALMDKFPFIDAYGQYMFRDWEDKIRSDEDFAKRLKDELAKEAAWSPKKAFTQYGGWKEGPQLAATGFFYTTRHEGRWWFVDPEGYLFWSFGATCVGEDHAGSTPVTEVRRAFDQLPPKNDPAFAPFYQTGKSEAHHKEPNVVFEQFNFAEANLYRKYGDDWEAKATERTLRRAQRAGLNTLGAWSDNEVVAARKIPYMAMVHYDWAPADYKMPDPFDPRTEKGLREAIKNYPVPFHDDPWCLGVFVDNEIHWEGSNEKFVALIMGYEEADTQAKLVFKNWLQKRYASLDAFKSAWNLEIESWDALTRQADPELFRKMPAEDCRELAILFAEAYFSMVDAALNDLAPNHLYMGCRFNLGSEEVVRTAAKYVDVISINLYKYTTDIGHYGSFGKPVVIGEYHFADASDRGLGGGLHAAQDSLQQGRLIQAYARDGLNHEMVVGVHWFQWKDQSVGGRFDGENHHFGFADVTDNPNESLIEAAAAFGHHWFQFID
jgi:hypothetical protein